MNPAWHLVLIVLAVPAQLLLSKWTAKPQEERDRLTRSYITSFEAKWRSAVERFNEYTDLQKLLQKWLDFFFSSAPGRKRSQRSSSTSTTRSSESKSEQKFEFTYGDDDFEQESEEQKWFAGSSQPRDPRPARVKYRVGQVIRHQRWGYRGVIVGWDVTAQASEAWLEMMHPKDKPHWREQPNYSILVDVRDRADPQLTYIPEENIQIVEDTISHPKLSEYFDEFDGFAYRPRQWLRERYPHD